VCVGRLFFYVIINNRTVANRSRFIEKTRKSDFLFLFICLFRLFFSFFFLLFFCYFSTYQHTYVCVFCLTENHLYCYNCITVAICFLFGYYSCCCLKREKKYILGTIKFSLFLHFFYSKNFMKKKGNSEFQEEI
jgi:hypothetical protein